MTPRIRMIVARFFSEDATGWHFIDIGEIPEHTDRRLVDADVILHPPYPRTVFVGTDHAGSLFATRVDAGMDHVVVAGVGVTPAGRANRMEPVAFIRNPDGVGLHAISAIDEQPLDDKTLARTLRWAYACFDALPKANQAFVPTARPSFINAKRTAKGKPPALYDWATVTIEPPQLKRDTQGGTHASPRWHERRGHFRRLRNGDTTWVRNCVVGDAARGARFKDYRVDVEHA